MCDMSRYIQSMKTWYFDRKNIIIEISERFKTPKKLKRFEHKNTKTKTTKLGPKRISRQKKKKPSKSLPSFFFCPLMIRIKNNLAKVSVLTKSPSQK